MNFDRFHDLQEKGERLFLCLQKCREAEMYARINPGISAAAARAALEKLFVDLSKGNGLRPQNLSESIAQNCGLIEYNREDIATIAHEIRNAGNDAVHQKIAYVDAATRKNVERAMSICRMLFELLSYFYGDRGDFDPEQIPFLDLTIDRKIPDAGNQNQERYVVYRDGEMRQYYYLQCLSMQEEMELEKRRIEASKLVYARKGRRFSRILLPSMEQLLPEKSDRKILLYCTEPDSILLSELQRGLSPKGALEVGMELCEGLMEMEKLGISHRYLYPGSILLEELEDGSYDAFILDLQTCKIRGSDATVNHKLAAAWDRSCYIPRNLHHLPSLPPNTPWDKLDVYALCRVVLFCMDRQLALAGSTATLRAYGTKQEVAFSDDFMKLYKIVFTPNPNLAALPAPEELRRIFENAIT